MVKTSVRNTLSAGSISVLVRKFFAHIYLPSDRYLKRFWCSYRVTTGLTLTLNLALTLVFTSKNRTGIDPALSVLQTEAFTTQLSRQIAEESPIWNDLMFLFKDNLMSDETPYHLSFSALFVSASVQ